MTEPQPTTDLLPLRDAARSLGIDPLLLRQLCHLGRVDAFRDNRDRWRVRLTEATRAGVAASDAPPPVEPLLMAEEIDDLAADLDESEAMTSRLTALVARHEDAAARLERIATDALAARDAARDEANGLTEHLGRTLALLDRAVGEGQRAADSAVRLEAALGRALGLLEASAGTHQAAEARASAHADQLERALALLDRAAADTPPPPGLLGRLRRLLGGASKPQTSR